MESSPTLSSPSSNKHGNPIQTTATFATAETTDTSTTLPSRPPSTTVPPERTDTAAGASPSWRVWLHELRQDRWTAGVMVSFVIFTDMLFYAALVPILPYIVEETLHLGAEYSGILMSAYAAGLLIFTPVFGYVSDRFMNRRVPMLCSLVGLLLTSIVLRFCTTYWQYLCLRILQGISAAGSWTVGLALATDAFPAHQLGSIMGLVLGAMHFGYTAGPTLGGLLFDAFGLPALCYFFVAMTLVAILFRLFAIDTFTARLKAAVPDPAAAPPIPILRLLAARPIWVNGLVILVLATVTAGLDAQLSTWLIDIYQLNVAQAGFTFLAISIPGLLISPLAGYLCDKFSLSKILLIGMCGFIFITPWIAYPKSYTWTTVTLVLFGIFYPIALTPTLPDMGDYVQQVQPKSASQVYSVFNVAFSIGMLVGPLIQGFIYVSHGFLLSLIIFALVCLVTLFVYVYYMRYPGWTSKKRESVRMLSHASELGLIGTASDAELSTVSMQTA